MHKSSLLRMQWFVKTFIATNNSPLKILDVGSYDVNGTYKQLFNDNEFIYIGLDMSQGPNVDLVPQRPYIWEELEDESFDVVISGQAFEHIEFPWIIMAEIARILKKKGLLCLIVPRLQGRHRHPVDTYRYDVDGVIALARYTELIPLHASMNLGPRDCSQEWYSQFGDTMLVAQKPNEWTRGVDISSYIYKPIDINKLTNGFITHKEQSYPIPFQGLFADKGLDTLGVKYGTDKNSKHHDYLRKYDFFLKPWKEDVFTCLELGISSGRSLKMWKEYFSKAKIVGVDINPSCVETVEGIECRIGDLGDIDFLASLQMYAPRLIIDDASHRWDHMITAFFTLFPHVKPGGIYILENICTSFEPWASAHKSYDLATPFHVMQTLAECLTSQMKTQSGKQILPLSPPSPYQSFIEAIAKTVDCVVFIKFSCLVIKKQLSNPTKRSGSEHRNISET